MKRNWQILKGLLPIIIYLVFIGLLTISFELDILFWGVRESDTPVILPTWIIYVIALPLIGYGYVLLFVAQHLYRKNRKWFKLFAWIVTVIGTLLPVIIEYYTVGFCSWLCHSVIVFSKPLWFYIPFFLGLSYVFRKTEDTKDGGKSE